ncbi:MbtH family NRPS accessory protein [Streptomyces viridochromogenes]|uniref:Uncharacterized protein n=1 Tax=Streptomyces viridochromogenes Tue57 TaxID=1160705 RepID=L8PJ58_STRVR|nr:MbtH family NRPS accessory protein [Streptomyces viridochromogenes]ELS56490.1 hypothetical protein STVIR_2588 [Streptomyces viridochromogenes Tue57]
MTTDPFEDENGTSLVLVDAQGQHSDPRPDPTGADA